MTWHDDCEYENASLPPAGETASQENETDPQEGVKVRMSRLPITYRAPTLRRWPELGSDFDRLFEGVLGRPVVWADRAAADLYETDEEYVLELELPGYSKEEVDVSFERGALTISGARSHEAEDEGKTYHVRECSFERFNRTFTLPETVRTDDVRAELEGGVLKVRLPKAPDAKPRRIQVSSK